MTKIAEIAERDLVTLTFSVMRHSDSNIKKPYKPSRCFQGKNRDKTVIITLIIHVIRKNSTFSDLVYSSPAYRFEMEVGKLPNLLINRP